MLIVKLEYRAGDYIKKMEPEQYQAFLEAWPCADKTTKQEAFYAYEFGKQRMTMEETAALSALGIPLEIEGIDGTMLTKMAGQTKVGQYGEVHSLDLTSGATVQIAVPDIGLLQINQVDWLADACTQELQCRLDDGWRILAVCPPNAQRRPDYILGRFKQKD